MKETEFTEGVWRLITPEKRPDLFRVVVDGLVCTLPEELQRQVAGHVWGWRPSHPLAPDLLVAGENDQALAVFEFKSLGADANSSRLSTYRRTPKADDPVAQRIADAYLSADAAFDRNHDDDACGGICSPYRTEDGLHYPSVEQADVYRSTTHYFLQEMTVGSLTDLLFVFISPHQKSKDEFFARSVCREGEEWQVVELEDVLRHWSQHVDALDGADRADLARLINAGRHYLPAKDRDLVAPVT